ncbi:MAG: PAS domain S-box protein [Ignavibacteria bacterium]|nr:PAS domain S-box protein [Ignavibacteria bacterium]
MNDKDENIFRKKAEKISAFRNVLIELVKIDKSDYSHAIKKILQMASDSLEVERVSYWSTGNNGKIVCEYLYDQRLGDFNETYKGFVLKETEFPKYFKAIKKNIPIIADNAREDENTNEFTENYLIPNNITSMLDIPVWYKGNAVGVLCHEHTGEARNWLIEEIDYANSIAIMISLAKEESERNKFEEELYKSREKFRLIADNLPVPVIISKITDGNIMYGNDAFLELSGIKKENLTEFKTTDLYYDPNDRDEVIKLIRQFGQVKNFELRAKKITGEPVWVLISNRIIEFETEKAIATGFYDITERKKAEDEIIKAFKREKELSDLKSRFVTMVSHELRTPLTIILSNKDFLKRNGVKINEDKVDKSLNRIGEAVTRIEKLLNDVLIFGSDENYNPLIHFEYINLGEIIDASVKKAVATKPENFRPEINIENNIKGEIYIDKQIISEILDNLVENAVKFSRNGNKISIKSEMSGTDLVIQVGDLGIGIPENEIIKITEPFYKAENAKNINGTGLGLAIVSRNLEILNGSIDIQSVIDKETNIKVTIPIKQ